MRLSYTTDSISNTTLVDDADRPLYTTTSSTIGGKTELTKFDQTPDAVTLATMHLHQSWESDTITINGQQRLAMDYLIKPSRWSRRRTFTSTSGRAYEWTPNGNVWKLCLQDGREVGRSHTRSLRLPGGKKHKPYLEFNDNPDILNDLDELVATFVYVQVRREKARRAGSSGAAAGVAVTV
ncbi:unnamed protein product [Peniophora sp. CBMAI 1063]|nr:unnamed protein product [Peniophora sp. CBMAI 1063]